MTRPTYVLGCGLSHDGSVCLLEDGRVKIAIEKERLSRIKHDGGNDAAATDYVLHHAGISLDDVAVIVQNENFGMFHHGNGSYDGAPRRLREHDRVVSISHHLAHAYSAVGPRPFTDGMAFVLDGSGNAFDDCVDLDGAKILTLPPPDLGGVFFEKDSTYRMAPQVLEPVVKDFSPWAPRGRPLSPATTRHSIGGIYQAASKYVFGGIDDSGKLMGLAPYGRPGRFGDRIFHLIDGATVVDEGVFAGFDRPAADDAAIRADFEYYADLAWWVQNELERAVIELIVDRRERCGGRSLAYAGGVALNAVTNRRLLDEVGFESVFIQPAAGDAGIALGCAYYGWLVELGRARSDAGPSTCFGVAYRADDTRRRIDEVSDRVTVDEPDDLPTAVARLLAAGSVVAWFRGGSEFGPRALGHRSILAHPGLVGMRDHINRDIKRREDFRPFAPMVLADRVAELFDCGSHESPYMLVVFDVRTAWRDRIAEVVHCDGTARPQTVTTASQPQLARLLDAFEGESGIPALLNTSLNRRGMPIVETPAEALMFFLDSDLDALVLDDLLITKRDESGPRPAGLPRRRAVETLCPEDRPLLSLDIEQVAWELSASGDDSGIAGALDRVCVTVRGLGEVPLPGAAIGLLRAVDGERTYAELAAMLLVEVSDLLAFASTLSRGGLLDHVGEVPIGWVGQGS